MAGPSDSPNLWEELNRPRPKTPPPPGSPSPSASTPPPPTSPSVDPDHVTEPSSREPDLVPDLVAKLDDVDSQHLLIVGGAAFAVVAIVVFISALGGSSASDVDAATGGAVVTTAATEAPATSTPVSGPDATVDTAVDAAVETTPPDRLALDEEPAASTTTTTEVDSLGLELFDPAQSTVYRLYQTALGRSPDRDGFEFWADQVRNGVALTAVVDSFVASDEYDAQFGDGASDEAVLRQLIENGLGEPVSDDAMPTWIQRANGRTWSEVIVMIAESDEVVAATGTIR